MDNRTISPIPYIYYRELFRVVATAYAGEEGLYKEKPENLTTPVITVEIVYRVCVTTAGGEIQVIDFYNKPMKNKDNEEGGAVTLDGSEWFTEPGPGTTVLECKTVKNPTLDVAVANVGEYMYNVAKTAESIAPGS